MNMSLGLAVLITLGASVPTEQSVLAPRSYNSVVVDLEVELPPHMAMAYEAGNLWVSTGDGEIWRYDSNGKLTKIKLPGPGYAARSLYPAGPVVTALAAKTFFKVSTSSIVTPLREVSSGFMLAVPVRDGYAALDPSEDNFVPIYVADDGGIKKLSFASPSATEAPPRDERDIPAGATSTPSVDEPSPNRVDPQGDSDGSQSTATNGQDDASAPVAVPRDGVLAPLDPERVVYVTQTPYQAWILGIDGSSRYLAIDESNVIRPEDSAQKLKPGQKLLSIAPFRIKNVLSHGDRLVVERMYYKYLELTEHRGDVPAGTQVLRGLTLIDFIDLESGKITERVDTARVRGAGQLAGFKGDALVFASGGQSGSTIAIATPE